MIPGPLESSLDCELSAREAAPLAASCFSVFLRELPVRVLVETGEIIGSSKWIRFKLKLLAGRATPDRIPSDPGEETKAHNQQMVLGRNPLVKPL